MVCWFFSTVCFSDLSLFSFVLILCEFHIKYPIPFTSLSLHIFPCNLSEDKTKQSNKQISPWMLQCATVCHIVYTLLLNSLTCTHHHNESWIWCEAFDSCCTTDTESSPRLLSDISCCPVLWRAYSFESERPAPNILLQYIDGVDFPVGQLKVLDLGLGES